MSAPKPFSKPVSRESTLYELYASTRDLDKVIYPLEVRYRGLIIRILEISKVEHDYGKEYFTVVQICNPVNRKKPCTDPFTIACKDIDDFVNKLRLEVLRYRVLTFFYPELHG